MNDAVSRKELAVKGGKARAAKLTPEQRSEAARKAVQVRWARARALSSLYKTYITPNGVTVMVWYRNSPRTSVTWTS